MSTILLVEDEIVIALGIQMVLEDAGYSVVIASNGEEGLTQALEVKPDLIVTDYMMPRMNGLELIAALRSRNVTIPIVLATSIGEERVQANPHRLYDAYLGKPCTDDALLGVVRRLLLKNDRL